MTDSTSRRLRNRPLKAPLSLEAVVDAALECLHEGKGGPAGLTMRKVAARLETGPASLYAYVRGQRELHVLVLDSIAAKVRLLEVTKARKGAVVDLLLAYAAQLAAFPGAARLALDTQPTGPAFLDLLECAMQLLVSDGFSVRMAARAGDALFLLATASIAEQDARLDDDPGRSIPALFDDALDDASTERPLLSAGHEALRTESGELRLAWTLRALLLGIAESPTSLDEPARDEGGHL
jgi:AcrR family transcriptional regulator